MVRTANRNPSATTCSANVRPASARSAVPTMKGVFGSALTTLDVQAVPIDESDLPGFDAPQAIGAPLELVEKVRETIDALNRSERPLILVGNGVRLARARGSGLGTADSRAEV